MFAVWLGILVAAPRLFAQPGPSEPLTVAEARSAGSAFVRAHAGAGTPTEQLEAALDSARRIEHLARVHVGGAAGGPRSIEPDAEGELRRLTGFDFARIDERVRAAWQDCLATAARLHATNAAAQTCAQRALALSPREVVLYARSITPPPGFLAGDANAAATQYERLRATLAASPADATLRVGLAAMQLASFDFDAVITTLATLAGRIDADLAVALAHLGAGRVDEAERRVTALAARAPTSPDVHYALGLLLASRRYEREGPGRIETTRHALDALLRFLCLRGGDAASAADDAAWDHAAETASEMEHDLTGGTYWFYSSSSTQPPPFLPDASLPLRLRTGLPSARARWRCADVLGGAVLRLH